MKFIKTLWEKFKQWWIDNYEGIPTIDDEWFKYNGYFNENNEGR